MSQLDYFSEKSIKIELYGSHCFKLIGIASLQENLRNQVLRYAKINKQQILFEIKMQDKTIQTVDSNSFFCPARCKTNGKCYGTVYFDGKYKKSQACIPSQCVWKNRLIFYFKKEN